MPLRVPLILCLSIFAVCVSTMDYDWGAFLKVLDPPDGANLERLKQEALGGPLTATVYSFFFKSHQFYYDMQLAGNPPPEMAPQKDDPNVAVRFIDWKYNRTFNLQNVGQLATLDTFNASKPVVVIAPGFGHMLDLNIAKEFSAILIRAYYCRSEYNILVFETHHYMAVAIDWAYKNLEPLGYILADILYRMVELEMTTPADIHIVGSSIGARIANPVSVRWAEKTTEKIDRMTLLDPIPDIFREPHEPLALSKGMAAFVDVLHCNNGGFGFAEAVGHVDFYPNGNVTLMPGTYDPISSHRTCIRYYGESVYPHNTFTGKKCTLGAKITKEFCTGEENQMGFNANRNIPGVFYLKTSSSPPFNPNNVKECQN